MGRALFSFLLLLFYRDVKSGSKKPADSLDFWRLQFDQRDVNDVFLN